MASIFYDIETSEKDAVGQILNFAFVAVDEKFQVIDTLAQNVKISRLQLPRLDAILVNRVNVLEHQQVATVSELEAVRLIDAFIRKIGALSKRSKPAMIGFNSLSFDLDFIRTVMIRNGVTPYEWGVLHRDLYVVARYLMGYSEEFQSAVFAKAGEDKVSLRLGSLGSLFGVLEGEQSHESLSDVLLTIRLAQCFRERFGVDVRTFEPYQVRNLHERPRGTILQLSEPLRGGFKPGATRVSYPAVLLASDNRYALWVDLKKFQELKSSGGDLRESIRWRKFVSHIVTQDTSTPIDIDPQVAQEALSSFSGITLANYFPPTTCDIEEFIYRIDFDDIPELQKAIRGERSSADLSRDIKQIVKRFFLENYQGELTEEFSRQLLKYAQYRYGGGLKLKSDFGEAEKVHPTFVELWGEIEAALLTISSEDRILAEALQKFYRESEIYRVAGADLLSRTPPPREKIPAAREEIRESQEA